MGGCLRPALFAVAALLAITHSAPVISDTWSTFGTLLTQPVKIGAKELVVHGTEYKFYPEGHLVRLWIHQFVHFVVH